MEIKDKSNFQSKNGFFFFWKRKIKELSLFKNSSRKSLENSLRESENLYKTLIERSLECVSLSQNGRIILANEAFCKMLGYSMEEILKLGAQDLIAPEDRQRVIDIHYRRMNDELDTLNYSAVFLQKSGKRVTLEINSSTVKVNGKNASFITMRDMTKRIEMEKALRESETKYKTLVENSLDGITIIRNNRILFANSTFCKMLNYTNEELYSMRSINTMHPSEYEKALKIAERRKNLDASTIKEVFRFLTKEGEIKECESTSTLIQFEGEWASFFTSHDITERKKNEEELRITKEKLQQLNLELENKVQETAGKLTEANTQLIRVQKENLQSQFDVLKQQVNPHFLFNSLNVLTSLIKLDPDLAEKFSENLSKVYRYVLENRDNELVDLKTELQFLDAYILLLNIRFIDKLRVNINIPESRLNEMIIPLAMQLLIENAIKHNAMSKSVPLTIEIFIDEDNFLNIVNNLNERPSQLISTGIGLKNIENRYLLLNNTKPVFEKTLSHFVARVPLLSKA
jgi:PAS domain S-box-containing protein